MKGGCYCTKEQSDDWYCGNDWEHVNRDKKKFLRNNISDTVCQIVIFTLDYIYISNAIHNLLIIAWITKYSLTSLSNSQLGYFSYWLPSTLKKAGKQLLNLYTFIFTALSESSIQSCYKLVLRQVLFWIIHVFMY